MKNHPKHVQGGRSAQHSTHEHTTSKKNVARSIAGSIHAHMDADWEEHRTGEVWKIAELLRSPQRT